MREDGPGSQAVRCWKCQLHEFEVENYNAADVQPGFRPMPCSDKKRESYQRVGRSGDRDAIMALGGPLGSFGQLNPALISSFIAQATPPSFMTTTSLPTKHCRSHAWPLRDQRSTMAIRGHGNQAPMPWLHDLLPREGKLSIHAAHSALINISARPATFPAVCCSRNPVPEPVVPLAV